MFAVQKNTVDVARFLVAAKANVNAKDNDGKTALSWATECYSAEAAELLKAAVAR